MSNKKAYSLCYCHKCNLDFISEMKINEKMHCPKCSKSKHVDKVREMHLEKPLNYKRPWGVEEDKVLLDGIEQGCSYQEISEQLRSRTPQAVRRRLQTMRKRIKESETK